MCEIRENAMQKKQFQQNMKDKVRVFEDGGIRLLKRGQKGVVHAIFSRFGLVLVLLLLQAFALFSLLQWFGELLPHYFGGTLLVTAAMMVYLLNQDMDNSVRITWLVVTALMPVLGVPLFWYTKSDVGHNALKRRLLDLEGQTRAQLPQNEQTVELLQEQAPEAMPLARYLRGRQRRAKAHAKPLSCSSAACSGLVGTATTKPAPRSFCWAHRVSTRPARSRLPCPHRPNR